MDVLPQLPAFPIDTWVVERAVRTVTEASPTIRREDPRHELIVPLLKHRRTVPSTRSKNGLRWKTSLKYPKDEWLTALTNNKPSPLLGVLHSTHHRVPLVVTHWRDEDNGAFHFAIALLYHEILSKEVLTYIAGLWRHCYVTSIKVTSPECMT